LVRDHGTAQGVTLNPEQLLRVRATFTFIEHPSFTLPRNLRHGAHAGSAALATFATPSSAVAAAAAASSSAAALIVVAPGYPILTLATQSSFQRMFDYYTEVMVEKVDMSVSQNRILSCYKTFHEMVERDALAMKISTRSFLTRLDEKRAQRRVKGLTHAMSNTLTTLFEPARTTRVDG
jgi:hypothetical protein